MPDPSAEHATELLRRVAQAEEGAASQLLPLVYDELRRLAAHYMQHERPDHTLQATALVHDAFGRLVEHDAVTFNDRAHFLGVAARAMRQHPSVIS